MREGRLEKNTSEGVEESVQRRKQAREKCGDGRMRNGREGRKGKGREREYASQCGLEW